MRGKFKAYEYQNVILPIIVIRRLECVLIKWREDKAAEVVGKRPKLTEKELAKLVKADPKYTDTGGIFDIMAVTVIQTHRVMA